MATAYTVELQYMRRDGTTDQVHLTSSDVATALYLDPSGSGDIILDKQDCKIYRMLYSNTPATTLSAQVFRNGANTGLVLLGAANIPTAVSPQISMLNPIYVPAGSKMRFVQV